MGIFKIDADEFEWITGEKDDPDDLWAYWLRTAPP